VLLLVVWIAVVVLSLVVLGALVHGVFGALQRLGRELQAAERDVRPLLEQAQATGARAAALASVEQRRNEG
jgi:heme exporter protein D